ncbi:MAG: transcriptional regulator PpsR [Betaproteobacteria bacterium]|jgi:transcriptional regulator PpsR|nr:transcriptional regulator PpsR [Betaproteobacteria bacterium]
MNLPSQGPSDARIGHFSQPDLYLAGLSADTAASLITAATDVVLVIDASGVIRDAAFGSEELLGYGCQDWLGQAWAKTVTIESRPKVEAMLRDLGTGRGAKWRHLNHIGQDGTELPVSYSIVPVQAQNEAPSGVAHALAFGRDLRPQAALQQRLLSAQMSLETDYRRLRNAETRYRLLFQVTSDALLILDGDTERLEEGNTTAHALLGDDIRRQGWSLADSLDAASYAAVRQVFSGLRSSGRASPLKVRLSDGQTQMHLSVTIFRQEESSHLLLCFSPRDAADLPGGENSSRRMLADVMNSAPDAFVVTDPAGIVLSANRAFLQLTQLSNESLVVGESLDRWLGRAGVDLSVLTSNLRQRDVLRLFATRIKGEYGAVTDVEISAVAVTSGERHCLGFTIRDIGLRLSGVSKAVKELPRSNGEMTELVGRVPLKAIVRETTDLIEQLCIEAALTLTGDNRASAAEMLGLSRQSLYVKLRRFGIGDAAAESDGEH